MRQSNKFILVFLLFFANAASAATVTWLSDGRYVEAQSAISSESASSVYGTTNWDVAALSYNALQNTTIDTTSQFGGSGIAFMDGVVDVFSYSGFNVSFRVAGGGTTLDLSGFAGGWGITPEDGLGFTTPGGSAHIELKQGDTVLYSFGAGTIDYSGFLADGDYTIRAIASVGGAGYNYGGGEFDFLGEFGTEAVTFVPVPAAVWLFGSALAGLGWLRRRQPA